VDGDSRTDGYGRTHLVINLVNGSPGVSPGLHVLASARMLEPLSSAEQAGYEELGRREHELLNADDP
jgi:hypothetical protein